MKKILIAVAVLSSLLTSCEKFLDSENIYGKDLDSYYANPAEIQEALGAVYTSMYGQDFGGDEAMIATAVSDLALGGGGAGGEEDSTYADAFRNRGVDFYHEMWNDTYEGVYRANAIIERLQADDFNIDSYFESAELAEQYTNQVLGEAYFMRALLMYRAARFFGGMPLILKTDTPRDVPRSSYTETFRVVLSDFQIAINLLPNVAASSIPSSEYGRANRWVAMGYLSRAYMFYTGYMTNIEGTPTESITLNAEAGGAQLTKQIVIEYLEDCRDNSGYNLVDRFGNLWAYSHLNYVASQHGDPNGDNLLPWAKSEGLRWAGQDGFTPVIDGTTGNSEVMFSVRHGIGAFNTPSHVGISDTNRMCIASGPRDNRYAPFFQGWGFFSVHPKFYAEWSDADERKAATVYSLGDATHRTDGYKVPSSHQFTNLLQKKYTGMHVSGSRGVMAQMCYVYDITSVDNAVQLGHAIDFTLMRFADILLMHSELTENADGMNRVRQRAGLDPIAYTTSALKAERMYEFAFEGLRWFDLVRWGDINTSDNYYGVEVDVKNNKVDAKYSVKYPSAQKGLFKIPETEISLSKGVYKQNPGW